MTAQTLSGRVRASCLATVVAAAVLAASPAASQSKKYTAPEVFSARASMPAQAGRGDAYVTIRVDRYSAPKDVETMEKALKEGGSSAFVLALKRAPVVGRFEVADKSVAIRWARERATDTGREISFVTESPIYFVGGGIPGAKSREGYELGVLQLIMDSSNVGEGKMAAAARVKPGGKTGVEIDAYEGEPVKLLSVMRKIS